MEDFRAEHPELERMTKLPNIIMSSHVAFFTDESVFQIQNKTLNNYEAFTKDGEIDKAAIVALVKN